VVFIKYRFISERNVPYTIKYSNEPQRSLFYEMWARCHRVKNFTFTTTTGLQGSGKSYGNIYMGWMLDVNSKTEEHLFTEENVIFNPIEFVNKVNHPDHIGQAFMKDEIEMDANTRDQFTKLTKIIGDVISTIRYKRSIIFFNLPSEKQLDAQVRRLRYGNFDFKGVSSHGTYSKFMFEKLDYPRKADTDYKYHKIVRRDPLEVNHLLGNNFFKVTYADLKLELPFKIHNFSKILANYDKRKDEYLTSKLETFTKDLEKLEKNSKKASLQIYDMIDMIEKNKDKFVVNGTLSIAELQRHFGISQSQCQLLVKEYKGRNGISKEKARKKKEREKFIETIKNSKTKLKDLIAKHNI